MNVWLEQRFIFWNLWMFFSFTAVDKKRALKKEEWPVAGSLEDTNRYDVKVQLMAGNVEIQNCDGCASWKDKTRKPFLVLTPMGERCVHYVKNAHPFLLLIFRCCPKFHSCNKQFRLVITVTSPFSGETFRSELNIYRKKMISNKKRKTTSPQTTIQNETSQTPPFKPQLPNSSPNLENIFPLFPSCKGAHVVSHQLMYELLYAHKDKVLFMPERMHFNLPFLQTQFPPLDNKSQTSSPVIKSEDVNQSLLTKLKTSTTPPFWNFDAHPNLNSHHLTELPNDERWLDSVFSEINGVTHSLPRTLDDISALLDLPDESLPGVSLDP